MNPLDHLEDDIRDHIDRETSENIDLGMTPEEARRAALRKFGNIARVMEQTRDVWRWVWLEQLLQDVRYGLRFLRRNPRFSAVVVLTLALGIGVNTAVFSVVNTVLLKPLAYPHPERLVWLGTYDPHIKRDMVWMPDFVAWREQARSYTAMAAFGYQQAAIETPQSASQVTGVYGIGDFWKITGAKPVFGRLFGEEEQDCLVLSWDLFQQEFAGDPKIVGTTVILNGRPAVVTGVLPRGFRFELPMWWVAQHPEPVRAYFALPAAERRNRGTQVVASLRTGFSIGNRPAGTSIEVPTGRSRRPFAGAAHQRFPAGLVDVVGGRRIRAPHRHDQCGESVAGTRDTSAEGSCGPRCRGCGKSPRDPATAGGERHLGSGRRAGRHGAGAVGGLRARPDFAIRRSQTL